MCVIWVFVIDRCLNNSTYFGVVIAIKDHFSEDNIAVLGRRFLAASEEFPEKKFIADASKNLKQLEYRQRVSQIGEALYNCFLHFEAFAPAAIVVLKAWIKEKRDYRHDFICESLGHVVQHYGLHNPKLALDVMEGITQVFTAEWCIRPFIDECFDVLAPRFDKWKASENHHLRRLVSEGTRPNLPWGKKLKRLEHDPFFALKYLEHLSGDSSEYVRKSVSNHLNDFCKTHPDKLIEICTRLKQQKRMQDRDLRQALRNLIKAGNPFAMALVGVKAFRGRVLRFVPTDKVLLGEKFTAALELLPLSDQKIEVDYVFGFKRKDGTHGTKVFKGHRTLGKKNTPLALSFSLPIKNISTRSYYAGDQKIALQINGNILAESKFLLKF